MVQTNQKKKKKKKNLSSTPNASLNRKARSEPASQSSRREVVSKVQTMKTAPNRTSSTERNTATSTVRSSSAGDTKAAKVRKGRSAALSKSDGNNNKPSLKKKSNDLSSFDRKKKSQVTSSGADNMSIVKVENSTKSKR